MRRWAVGIVLALFLMTGGSLAMVWIALHNPPVLVQVKADEWKH